MRYLLPFLLGFTLSIAVGFTMKAARGHDYEKPELQDWFMSLHSKKGSLCCDGRDATHVAADEWATQNKEDSHYKVNIDGEWIDVPDSAIVDEPNKEGQALVWFYPMWIGTKQSHAIRCFMPGTLS